MKSFEEFQTQLALTLPDYERREPQGRLASFIESHLAKTAPHKDGLAEAGTGVGKSLGYLIPAILSGKRVIISTATKALQDQISQKDLPFLKEHLGVNFTFAVLKGKTNYLCKSQHAKVAEENSALMKLVQDQIEPHQDDASFLAERDDFFGIDDKDWASLTISSADCPGKKQCPFGGTCFSENAKNIARTAQVVVVNHALFLIDLWLKDITAGTSNILGAYDAVVFDEAHELEEWATNTWKIDLRLSSMERFGTDLRGFAYSQNGQNAAERLIDMVPDYLTHLNGLWDGLKEGRLYENDIANIGEDILALYNCLIDMDGLLRTIDTETADIKVKSAHSRLEKRLSNLSDSVRGLITNDFNTWVRWVDEETFNRRTAKVLHSAPIDISGIMNRLLFDTPTISILVSATMSVGNSFNFLAGRLGVTDFDGIDVGTPFDYVAQSALYIPSHLPAPDAKGRAAWESGVLIEISDLVKASDGRALLLFTSNKQLKTAYDYLSTRLPYTCIAQGQKSNKALASEFMADKHSVLFATRSFFTGVDFQGDSCSLVVIDKLPFSVPTEPVFQARCEAVKRAGKNDFGDFVVPGMSLILKQAHGRLIRHRNDRGVVAILDSRITSKGYGAKILRSLPPSPLVTTMGEIEEFYGKGDND